MDFLLSLIVLALFFGLPIYFIKKGFEVYKLKQEQEVNRLRSLNLFNVDSMSGVDFEVFIKSIMESRGLNVSLTKASGDLGVDLIAEGVGQRIAIQCKRYSSPVSRRAISDAVAGMAFYGCNEGMVITNNYFTKGALELATANRCILVDRDMLAGWITEFSGPSLCHDNVGKPSVQVSPTEAIGPLVPYLKHLLFSFSGRINRGEFLWAIMILIFVFGVFFSVLGESKFKVFLFIPFGWTALALQVKRWHDRNKSGAWLFINMIPYFGLMWSFIELGLLAGIEPNDYTVESESSH